MGNILVRIRCPRIGIGYADLPNHKVNMELNQNCSAKECIHRMIHIHKDFMKEVYIDFGLKRPHNDPVYVIMVNKKLDEDYNGAVTLMYNQIHRPIFPDSSNSGTNTNNYDVIHGSNVASVSNSRHNPLFSGKNMK